MGTMIVSDPKMMMGKPVVAGTRITVESILESLGAGESVEDLLQAHPRLTEEAIQAALRFAAAALRADAVYPGSDQSGADFHPDSTTRTVAGPSFGGSEDHENAFTSGHLPERYADGSVHLPAPAAR
jgi:uncharacterized protein (DUF433 family)